ncbi:hypothetical protein J2T20_003959 [Paenibacillus wynnii]|nr:hypothetical protein [Paenibacillus wynnii]
MMNPMTRDKALKYAKYRLPYSTETRYRIHSWGSLGHKIA